MDALHYVSTLVGRFGFITKGEFVTRVILPGETTPLDAVARSNSLPKRAEIQLYEYLSRQRRDFNLPLAPEGTEFKAKVWSAICAIPYGETSSYGAVARDIGRPRAARAVGGACRRNLIPIFIPRHRVIGASGKMVGFLGGLDLKERLLALERGHALL
ncbi:MAG: methylated-DNA--[protein]-cysteine S-methyltransferase [Methanomassiliicoccales archaeon]